MPVIRRLSNSPYQWDLGEGDLNDIANKEGLNITKEKIISIQQLYKSDIRSMINCIQSQQNNFDDLPIITKEVWENLYYEFEKGSSIDNIYRLTLEIGNDYKINKNTIIKLFLNYLIRYNKDIIKEDFLKIVDNLMHMKEGNSEYNINYLICCMKELVEVHNTHLDVY